MQNKKQIEHLELDDAIEQVSYAAHLYSTQMSPSLERLLLEKKSVGQASDLDDKFDLLVQRLDETREKK